jgi:site-specific DNA-methyltransferase (adenine-specific)/modification methylase
VERYYEHAGITIYHGDCREILPTLGRVDAVVTDPPYGIGENSKKVASRGNLADPTDYGHFDWDKIPAFDAIDKFKLQTKDQIIWGGQFYPLSPTSCWLIWDKLNGNNDFADCEIAWTSINGANRIIRHMWNGMIRSGEERGVKRVHPTQKPVEVMRWCLSFIPADKSIIDPFMGSGTTGVACAKTGRKFTGIEINQTYFDIACKRIEEAYKQPDMFVQNKKEFTEHEKIQNIAAQMRLDGGMIY